MGLGVNHEPVVQNRWGLPWDKPYSRLVEYLDALIPLMQEQAVSVSGEYTTHHTEIDVPAPAPSLMLAALGPRMLRLAADRSDGTITWMTGPKTVEAHIRPHLGADSHIVSGVGIVLTNDVDGARAFANTALAIYPTLPSYRTVMEREGATEAADMMIIGGPDEVRAGIAAYRDAGVDELAANIFGSSKDFETTVELLAEEVR